MTAPPMAGRVLLAALATEAPSSAGRCRHKLAGCRVESATSSEVVPFWLAPWETYRLVFNGLGWEVRSSDWLMSERIYYLTARNQSDLALPTSTGEQLQLNTDSVYFLQPGAAGWGVWLLA